MSDDWEQKFLINKYVEEQHVDDDCVFDEAVEQFVKNGLKLKRASFSETLQDSSYYYSDDDAWHDVCYKSDYSRRKDVDGKPDYLMHVVSVSTDKDGKDLAYCFWANYDDEFICFEVHKIGKCPRSEYKSQFTKRFEAAVLVSVNVSITTTEDITSSQIEEALVWAVEDAVSDHIQDYLDDKLELDDDDDFSVGDENIKATAMEVSSGK